MGCSAAPMLFEKFATFVEWLVRSKPHSFLVEHYLDDFFFVGNTESNDCQHGMAVFQGVCDEMCIPLSQDKIIDSSSTIIYPNVSTKFA
jgi:hypothetical protein